MPIPPSVIGTSGPPVTMTVERGRLRLFAKATGQTDPVYVDLDAARAGGHPDLPVPPTFLYGIDLEVPDPFEWITSLGVDLNTVLHATQTFTYHRQAYAGDELTAHSTIADVYTKKGGALEFVERRTRITRGETPIADLAQTVVIRVTGGEERGGEA
ncbi:acyl dehydratase [Thermocatellispora tengchongensis]|uniref:Acyl dehydratase n=1 Tax=Thermocatellispora tengchongensis TaxID=1073253 RepID=A0A840PDI1_9ACTN|nr:MaoC family dehydratase N-terminal domain-containing protein [Thermocatellispora tengchongensis]MBB5135480.1 acyl dehydratase [Thermocatellispora tengchongensis]